MIKIDNFEITYNDGPTILVVDNSKLFYKNTQILDSLENFALHDVFYYLFEFDHIHPNKISEILPTNKGLIVTINKAVIDHFVVESAEHAKKTVFSLFDGNIHGLTDEESEQLYSAYVVGIQHVSEILLCQGIWRS